MQYARECFNHQHRLFLFMISIDGRLARFIRADRSEHLISAAFDYLRNPTPLWCFIYAFSKMQAWQRGHDPTASLATIAEADLFRNLSRIHPEAGQNAALRQRLEHAATPGCPIYALNIYAKWSHPDEFLDTDVITSYTVHRLLVGRPAYTSNILGGKGTKGFVAYDLADRVAVWIKDSWRPVLAHAPPEFEIYQTIVSASRPAGHIDRCFLTLRAGADVDYPPDLRFTGDTGESQSLRAVSLSWQSTLALKQSAGHTPRRHCRLVFKEVCRTLEEFRTPQELLVSMVGALKAHYVAWESAHILHRDISPSNILIYDPPDGGCSYGKLADWDLARPKDIFTQERQPAHCGTWQFLSIALQCEPSKPHELSDDLESFSHTLSWCIYKYFKHSHSGEPELLADFAYSLFDSSDLLGLSGSRWSFSSKFSQLRHGVPLVRGLEEAGNGPLASLTFELAKLCSRHYHSPTVRRLWYDDPPPPSDEDEDEAGNHKPDYEDEFGRITPADIATLVQNRKEERASKREEYEAILKRSRDSPFRTHVSLVNAFRRIARIDDEYWLGVEKIADQLSTNVRR
ncbi:hypothetical protein GY45DRAFT_1304104 [Cubamyces sp. BRFM 1775]|nr:hypothetical protein GY45DRAFT_1304104 [Cubamyces sp. BRFM 1775]